MVTEHRESSGNNKTRLLLQFLCFSVLLVTLLQNWKTKKHFHVKWPLQQSSGRYRLCFRCCVSPRRKRCWRNVWLACVKKTLSSERVWPLYTRAWLFMTNSTSSTASRYIYKYIQIHDLLVLKHTFKNQAVQCRTVWFSVSMKRASITKGFPAPGLAAWVSAGSWKTLLNNHLIPVIVTFYSQIWIPLAFVQFRARSLESGMSGYFVECRGGNFETVVLWQVFHTEL